MPYSWRREDFKREKSGEQGQTLKRRQIKRCHEKCMIYATHLCNFQIIQKKLIITNNNNINEIYVNLCLSTYGETERE